MWVAGDEFLHTQRGNNNPYNQDNETTWLDWARLEGNADFHRFFRLLLALRRRHLLLGSTRFWRDRVTWHGVSSEADRSWTSHSLAFKVAEEEGRFLYVMINGYWEELSFQLPGGTQWQRAIDTGLLSPLDIMEASAGEDLSSDSGLYQVRARSIAALIGVSE
jgi:glycogen operon protein